MEDKKEPRAASDDAREAKPSSSSSQPAGKAEGSDSDDNGEPLTILGRLKKWLSVI